MKKIVHPSLAWQHSLNVLTYDNVSKNHTNVMEYLTVMMEVMSLDAPLSPRISAIKKNTSNASHQAFVFQLPGVVTDPKTVMITLMKMIAEKLRVPTTFINVTTINACLRHMFAMEKMIAAMDPMKEFNMLARNHQSNVHMVNGRAQVLLIGV